MVISYELFFLVVSTVIYYNIKEESFKYYALYNIFLIVYVLSRNGVICNSARDQFAKVMSVQSAEIVMDIVSFYIQILFYIMYSVFALKFLDLEKHIPKYYSALISLFKIFAVFYLFSDSSVFI